MEKAKFAGTAVVLGAGLVYIAKRLFLRSEGNTVRRDEQPAGNWREVGVITGLAVYPVKSFRGIQMNEGWATSIGIEEISKPGRVPLGDRRMIVYNDSSMEFVTARTFNHMVNVRVEAASENDVTLIYQNESITFKLPTGTTERRIRLWTETVSLVDCGDEVASWLQDQVFSGKKCYRLGYWANPEVRRHIPEIVEKYSPLYPFMRDDFTGAYSDLSPYLLLSESSVEHLNKQIEERSREEMNGDGQPDDVTRISCGNFRGNLIVRGPAAFEEDGWKWVKIGSEVIFRNFKPCTRCSLTTINPDTGVRDRKMEPLTTLKTYRMLDEEARKVDKSPAMGIYLGLWTSPNLLKVGDPVYVCD